METFVNIVRTGNLSKTARQLGISRAIVTRHLQQLEEHLGARLFNRTTRQVILTDIGERYYAFCTKVLSEIEEEDSLVSRQQNQPRGNLRLLASPSFGNMRLGPLIADFINAYPNIQVTMELDSYDVTELEKKTFDLAVHLSVKPPDTPLVGRKIGEVRWLLCAAPKYLERAGIPKTPADLTQHDCVLLRIADRSNVWTFVRNKEPVTIEVSGSLVTNSVIAAKAAVVKGLGISILPEYCLGDDLENGTIRELLPGYTVTGRAIYVLYRYSRYLPNKVRVFIDFLHDRLKRSA